MNRIFTDTEEQEISKIYVAGHSERSIARSYNVSRDAIRGALRRQGVERRSLNACYELHNRFYQLNPYKFDAIDNEASAYWLGFLMADGYVHGRQLSISLKGSDKEHLQRFLNFLESDTPIRDNIIAGKYPTSHIEVTHEHLTTRLRELGLVTHRPNPLQPIEFIHNSVKHHFIRGYWDGDGYAATNPNDGIGFCGPEPLMFWIKDTIASLSDNLTGKRKLTHHPISDIYYLRYSGRHVALSAVNVIFSDATVFLPRKRDVVRNWPPPQVRFKDELGRYT